MKANRSSASALEAPEKLSMQQNAFLQLKEMIKQGRIRPGEKLLEVQVAKAFGISRSPARHALQALCEAKMVQETSGRGYQVAGRSKPEDVGQVALLEKLQIAPSRQWERVYAKVEQELCIRVLFGSVRVIEAPLAEYFGVSRTVARDVLGRMQSVGMVSKDGLGHWFAEQVSSARIRHLFEIRAILEPEALRQAAPFFSREELERISRSLRFPDSGTPMEMSTIGRAETDMHVDLLSRCPNREIIHALKRTHVLFVPSLYLVDPNLNVPRDILETVFHEHLMIVDQLLAKNVRKASANLRRHLEGAHARWMVRFEIAAKSPFPALPPYLTERGRPLNLA